MRLAVAAVKINMRLDAGKMERLLQDLAATERAMSSPHGRPVALRYATRDIPLPPHLRVLKKSHLEYLTEPRP